MIAIRGALTFNTLQNARGGLPGLPLLTGFSPHGTLGIHREAWVIW